MAARVEAERLAQAAESVRWWPSALALVVLGAVYALVSASLTLGPPWWLLVLTVVVVPGTFVLRSRGFMRARRMVAFGTLAATTPGLAIGVHLVLTYAQPLSNPARIRSLVREDGSFWRPSELLAREIDRIEALMEYRAQFARARELIGREPTHVDTHHWVHDHPALSWAVCELALETGAAARTHTPEQRDEYRAKGVRTPDHFTREFQHPGHIGLEDLLTLLAGLEDGVTELMCHPGEPDPDLVATSAYARERPLELAVLTDPRVRSAIERDHITLTTFAAL